LSASESVTALRQILQKLIRPTLSGGKVLEKYGLSLGGVQGYLHKNGLLKTLEMLRGRFKGNTKDLSTLFNGVQGFNGVLSLTGKNASQSKKAFDEVARSQGALDNSFKKASHTAQFQFAKALATMKVAAIQLGSAILPTLVPILQTLGRAVGAAARWFSHLPKPIRSIIVVIGLLLIIAGPLLVMLGAVAIALEFLSANPIVLAIAGIVALVAAVIYAYHRFGWFRNAVKLAWSILRWTPMGVVIQAMIAIAKAVWNARHSIASAAKGIWNGLKTGLQAAVNFIVDRLNNIIDVYNNTVARIPGVDNIGHVGHVGGGGGGGVVLHHRSGSGGSAGHGPSAGMGHAARGGLIGRSGMIHVGEHGPEQAWLPGGTVVKPYDAITDDDAFARRAPTVHVNVQPHEERDIVVHSTVAMPNGDVLARSTRRAALKAKAAR
jgi:hypothetical protein